MKKRITREYLFNKEDIEKMVEMHLMHIEGIDAIDARKVKVFLIDNQTTIRLKAVIDNYSKE